MTSGPLPAATHWDDTYLTKGEAGVSWHQDRPTPSLEALDQLGVSAGDSVIDVGGGASTLVDELLTRGHRHVTVLDVSAQALSLSEARLGTQAALVTWLYADLLRWDPDRTFDVWHDRAVFHFLTTATERDQYRSVLDRATHEESVLVIGTFAEDGPQHCSGLPVCRYSNDELVEQLPPTFAPIASWRQVHDTPWRATQPFTWLVARRGR
ncbi:MAG: class I SAM-dependent methyltransferase [Jiangellaceae bacterium]